MPGVELSIVGLIFAALSALVSILQEYVLKKRHGTTGDESLEDRITKLTSALTESASLVSQIEDEIKQRQSVVERLELDAKTYQEIANLRRPEVEAVAQVIRGEIKSESRRSFWIQIAVNFVFFVAGIVVTLVLT